MYPELFHIGPLTVYSYGLMIGLGVLAAYLLAESRAKRRGVDADPIFTIAIIVMIGGILGAKLLYYITELKSIIENPRLLLDIGNGFVIYGGIIGGVLAFYLYARKKKLDFWGYFDLLIPSVPLAQGLGRIGCFLAGCCYGRATDGWCGIEFPTMPGVRVIPTQLISAIGDFAICAILLLLARRQKFKGQIAPSYMILYGVGRFIVEIWRADPRGNVGALSTSQFISIFIVAFGLLLYFYWRKKDIAPGVIPPLKEDSDADDTASDEDSACDDKDIDTQKKKKSAGDKPTKKNQKPDKEKA